MTSSPMDIPGSMPPAVDSAHEPSNGFSLESKGLEALVSPEQLKLLNTMDKLRAYGIGEFVSLPQIVVCGDQSAGKSSVLEAITEIQFPRKENLCTTFATEIALRRSAPNTATTSVSVSIIPGNTERSQMERDRLSGFRRSLNNFDQLPSLIEEARRAMDPMGMAKFSKDVLSIEITGPTQPHLTVVDLPGLIHVGQDSTDVELVSSLVECYMENPRSIILAVVAATNDYQNQIVLQRAKQPHIDPKGSRTLGIITKPDQIPAGSEKEAAFISLASNEQIEFELGWHVVRNRRYEERKNGTKWRNHREEEFFRTGAWKAIPRRSVGIAALRSRLSNLLCEHIKGEFPKVCDEIRAELEDCKATLATLGERRETISEQRIFLTRLSMEFGSICKGAVDGIYEDPFFGGWPEEEKEGIGKCFPNRLRAVVEEEKIEFGGLIRERGHTKDISLYDGGGNSNQNNGTGPQRLTRQEAIDWVKPLLRAGRGRELPRAFNRGLVNPLFHEQFKDWEVISAAKLDHLFGVCRVFLEALVTHITKGDEAISNGLFKSLLDKAIDERLTEAKKELDKLFKDRRGHPMTNNHDYIANLQMTEGAERQKTRGESFTKFGLVPSQVAYQTVVNMVNDLEKKHTQVILDDHACEQLLQSMLAYYKVASKTFVDNFGAQVIERHLMRGLWEDFSPITILSMSEEEVASIAGESPTKQKVRASLEQKRERLMKGLQTCLGSVA